jgi:replicative DNA helicase
MLNGGKLPPQATELEASILGACIIEPYALVQVVEVIQSAEVFYTESHQLIYTAITLMFERGTTIDMMTVGEELKKRGTLDLVGGTYAIAKLLENVADTAHLEEHCRIIVEKYIRREAIKFGYEAASNAYDDGHDVFDMLDSISNFANSINEQVVKKQYIQVGTSVDEVLQETALLMQKEVKLSGVPTGFRELTNITGGWQPGDLIIVAARPSVGKTAFLLNIAKNAAADPMKPTAVGIFSLEMGHDQLTRRLLANHADISLGDIKNGQLSHSQFEHLSRKASEVHQLPIYIDDAAAMTTIELRAKVRRMINVHNVGLVIIDYLQLMKGTDNKGNREQEISKISRELKQMAKTMGIPVIALSQLSRAVEGRSDPSPKLSDLRESGAIEQDADMVMFLYGHTKTDTDRNPDKKNERMVDIAKHRDGQLANFVYRFDGSRQRFYGEDLCMSYEPNPTTFTTMPEPEPFLIKRPEFIPNLLPLQQPSETPNEDFPF